MSFFGLGNQNGVHLWEKWQWTVVALCPKMSLPRECVTNKQNVLSHTQTHTWKYTSGYLLC